MLLPANHFNLYLARKGLQRFPASHPLSTLTACFPTTAEKDRPGRYDSGKASSVHHPWARPAPSQAASLAAHHLQSVGSGHSSSKLIYSLTKAHYVTGAAPEKH